MNASRCLALALTALSLSSYASAAVVSAGDTRRAPYGYRLDFISIGAGINRYAYDVVIEELQARLVGGNLREFTLAPWGREGERRVCFTLSQFGDAAAILAKAKIDGTDASLVSIEGTDTCAPKASSSAD